MKTFSKYILAIVLTLALGAALFAGAQPTFGKAGGAASPSAAPAAAPSLPQFALDEASEPLSAFAGHLRLNEVAPAAEIGSPAWVEIYNATHQLFLPILTRPGSTLAGQEMLASTAAQAGEPPLIGSLAGFSLSDQDGNTYTFPAGLPRIPGGAFVRLVLGSGVDDLDFSDGVATLYATGIPTDTFDLEGDQLLFLDAQGQVVDFVAWGVAPGEDDDRAVEAGLWSDEYAILFDQGFGVELYAAPPAPDASLGRWEGNWNAYYPAHSTPGAHNRPPTPSFTTKPDGSSVNGDRFGVAWTGLVGQEVVYEFQLSTSIDFSTLLVHEFTPYAGWGSPTPMPDGEYFWRARVIGRDGSAGAWIGPNSLTSFTLPAALNGADGPQQATVTKKLLDPSEYKIQRKDTTMLELDGLLRYSTTWRWNGPHVDNDIDKNPTFRWNGYDNITCARTSAAMIVDYYGGNLAIDRLSYYLFVEDGKEAANLKGMPEGDLGFGIGGSGTKALQWGLYGEDLKGEVYCPDENDEEFCYSVIKGKKISWGDITGPIDDGKPILHGIPGHVRVADGYMDIGNGALKLVHVLDPVPLFGDMCRSDIFPTVECAGDQWMMYEDFANQVTSMSYLKADWPKKVRHNELSIYLDSDSDGVNNFDELYRFFTDPFRADSDLDGIKDRLEIEFYTFKMNGNYQKQPADLLSVLEPDTLRKERDPDSDNDGYVDGCEDSNVDGYYDPDAEESDPYNWNMYKPCLPSLTILAPTTGKPVHVGPLNQAKNFWIVLDGKVMYGFPAQNYHTFTVDDFATWLYRKSGGIFTWLPNMDILSLAVQGEKIGLRVKPPTPPSSGPAGIKLNYYIEFPPFYKTDTFLEPDSVIFAPKQWSKTVITVGNHGDPGNPTPWLANVSATKLFLSQFSVGHSLGIVSLGGSAQVLTPLAAITETRQIDLLQAGLDTLTIENSADLSGGLELARQQVGNNPLDMPTILAAMSAPPAPGDPTFAAFGDTNFDGWVDGKDGLTGVYTATRVHTLAMGPGNAPWLNGMANLAGSTYGDFGFTPPSGVPGFLPDGLANRLADAYKALAEQTLGEERLLEAFGELDAGDDVTYTVHLDGASSIAFTAHFSDTLRGELTVLRPDGSPVGKFDLDVEYHHSDTHEHFRLNNPAAGEWTVVLHNTDPTGASTEYIVFASADSDLQLSLIDRQMTLHNSVGGPRLALTAALYDGDLPIAGATVQAALLFPDGTLQRINLFDNGLSADGAANDGIYAAAAFHPAQSGVYLLKIAASGLDAAGQPFQRHTQTSLAFRKPLALVIGAESDHGAAMELRDLLASAGLNLSLLPMERITATDLAQYDALLIDAASHDEAGWGLPAQRSALLASGLPIFGMGQGGHALFGDLGLDLGGAAITGTITTTMAVDAGFSAWLMPYALSAGPTYELYSASSSLALNIPVASPPSGVQLIGVQPATGYTNLGLEDLRFLLWGFDGGVAQMTADGRSLLLNLLLVLLQ